MTEQTFASLCSKTILADDDPSMNSWSGGLKCAANVDFPNPTPCIHIHLFSLLAASMVIKLLLLLSICNSKSPFSHIHLRFTTQWHDKPGTILASKRSWVQLPFWVKLQVGSVTVVTADISTKHESFNRIRQVAPMSRVTPYI